MRVMSPLHRLTIARPTRTALVAVLLLLAPVVSRAQSDVASGLIRCGDTLARRIIEPGEIDEITFQAQGEEVVSITAIGLPSLAGSLADLRWAVYAPDGRLVPTSTGDKACAGQCETRPLPGKGTFTIRVFDADDDGAGDYHLTLEAVSATADGVPNGPPQPTCARVVAGLPDGTRPIDRQESLSGFTQVLGETDTFTFPADAGEVLNIKVMSVLGDADTGFDPQWELFDPKGQRVLSATGAAHCEHACNTKPLPGNGVYTIKVSDRGHDARGVYTIRVRTEEPPPTTSTTSTTLEPTTTTTTLPPRCGNGILDEGEECDGGPGEATCPGSPMGGFVTCAAACTLDYATCTLPTTTSTTNTTLQVTTTTTVDATSTTTTTTTILATTTTVLETTITTTTLGTPVEPPLPFELGITLRGAGASPADASALGAATALHGDMLLLGAPHDRSAADDAGTVLVVDVAGVPGDPSFGQRLQSLVKPGTPAAGDLFGATVASVAGGVVVGAPGDGDLGAAYLFHDDGQRTAFLPPTPAPVGSPRFGSAVAGVGSEVAIGAPGAGQVHVFAAAGGQPLRTIDSPAGPGSEFGAALAASGATLLIGAPGNAQRAGQAFLADASTGAVVMELVSPHAAPGDEFGAAVAVAGTELVVAAPGNGAGRVLVFDAMTGMLLHDLTDPFPAAGDRFGAAIAVTQAGILVGAPSDSAQVAAGGAAFLFDPTSGALLSELRRPDPQAGAGFGSSVLGIESRLLIGAAHDDVGTVGGGAAYLFGAMGPEAVFRTRLSGSGYGTSVAAAGTELIVGAPRGGNGLGAVQRLDGTTGAVVATLQSPAGAAGFGFAVAAAGDLVVAAPNAGSGVAFLFDGSALMGELANPEPADGDQFGFSIAGDAHTVAVGVPLASGLDTGRVYLFDARTGLRTVTLQKSTPSTGDFFGAAVAMTDDKVLVGAPFDGAAAPSAGAAYLFDANTAVLLRMFRSPAPQADDMFGASVALSRDRVAIGVPMADTGVADAGRVYVFERATGNLLLTLESPTPHAGDQFGKMVALTDARVAVGAPLADGYAADAGAVFVFDAATGAVLETFLDPAQGQFDHFGAALSPTPNGLLVGAPGSSRVYFFAGSAASSTPVAQAVSRSLRPLVQALSSPRCGNGIVESGEVCDDGNQMDWDDCRSDCQGTRCCTLDAQSTLARCDDGNPCTLDSFDPTTGCSNVPNGTCCDARTPCAGGTCRVCSGCSFFPWACCEQGSMCLARSPECVGTECLAAAYCECGGGLACADQPVPDKVTALFGAGCDRLRLEESVVPDDTSPGVARLRSAKVSARTARKMMQKAAKATRKLAARRDLSRACGRELLGKIKLVKQSIPKSRQLRRCVLGR